jgi:hypothetical protein
MHARIKDSIEANDWEVTIIFLENMRTIQFMMKMHMKVGKVQRKLTTSSIST